MSGQDFKDVFDDQVRQRMIEFESPGSDGPELVVDDAVWSGVSQTLPYRKKRRRSIFFWLVLGVLALGMTALWLLSDRIDTPRSASDVTISKDENAVTIPFAIPNVEMTSRTDHSDEESTEQTFEMTSSSSHMLERNVSMNAPMHVHVQQTVQTPMEDVSISDAVPHVAAPLRSKSQMTLSSIRRVPLRQPLHSIKDEAINMDMVHVVHPIRRPSGSFALGVYGGSQFSNRVVAFRTPDKLTDFAMQERGDWAYEAGLGIRYITTGGWFFHAGLLYSQTRQSTNYLANLRYTRAGSSTDSDGRVTNDYQLKISTTFGEAEFEVRTTDASQTSASPLIEGQFIPLQLSSDLTITQMGIPLHVGYLFGQKRFRFGPRIGLISQFVVDSEQRLEAVRFGRPEFMLRQVVRRQHELTDLNTVVFEAYGALGLHWQINDRWAFDIESFYKRSLTPVFDNPDFDNYPYATGLQVGIWLKI